MCKEYIEREAALKVLCDACGSAACPKGLIPRCSYYEKMQSIPAADVRPMVRGKWNRTDAYPHRLYCSVCYKTYLKNDELLERWEFPLNFCPNCGAVMRGEQDGR